MGRCREESKSAVRRKKNTMHSRTIQSEGSAVHFEYNLCTTGLHVATSIKGSLKEGPG